MTQFSDSLYLGPVKTYLGTYTLDDLSMGDIGVGPMGTVYVYDTVPAALSTTSIRTASAQAAAGNATLNGTAVTAGVAALYVAASSPYNQQSVTISSTANLSAITFTVTGKDWRGRTVTEAVTGPSNSTVETAKTFRTVTSVSLSAGTGADTFSIGIGSLCGLPFLLSKLEYLLSVRWDASTTFGMNAATACAIGDSTSPATTTTDDVRGVLKPASTDPNGTRRLVVAYHLPVTAIGPSATEAGLFGVTQV